MTVGIVVVSHSDALSRGVVELCTQMAPEITITAAGGTDEGGIGTSLDMTMAALAEADTGDGAVILADLGSAEMTAQSAMEFLDPEQSARLRLADAPLVEGALAAATTAAGDADLDAVLAAAEAAGGGRGEPAEEAAPTADTEGAEQTTVVLPNPLGLHARPAAQVVAALRDLDAKVTISNTATERAVPADSLLRLAGLEATGGTEIRIAAVGPDATAAVSRVGAMAADGFGEAGDEVPGVTDGEEATRTREEVPTAAEPGAAVTPPEAGAVLSGVRAADGLVLGPAAHPHAPDVDLPAGRGAEDPDEERRRLDAACDDARAELERLAAQPEGDIFAAHLEILRDPAIRDAAAAAIEDGTDAAWAWADAVQEQERVLAAAKHEAYAARAADVRDVGQRVLRALLGVPRDRPLVPAQTIAVAGDLVPSAVRSLVEAGAAGVALAHGGRTSHVAVLARSLGLPMVVGLGPAVEHIEDGTLLRLDATAGELVVDPDPALQEETHAAITEREERRERERAAAAKPGRTADGTRVEIAANAASVAEARAAIADGAEGIGLLRTEFMFTDRRELPGEDEQVHAISAICAEMEGRPVILRTLDVGGDKDVATLDLDPIRNGFLGVRGIRLSLSEPALFRTQLRAFLRVAAAHRISIMFPMVAAVDEVVEARRALADARASLETERTPAGPVEQVGIMVEVPAAALDAAAFTEHVDFFSVGTNDLTAYTLAADRTLDEVASLYDPSHPAVLELIARLCDTARGAGLWVGVCGELAGEPDRAATLVRLGVRELSMAPASIPAVKARLLEVDLWA